MDLSRPVVYRAVNLNTAAAAGPGDPISGISLEQVLMGGAPGVGYTEKRSLTDGFDASDVYLGRRIWRARATVYGLTRADLYDRVQDLMGCIHPTAAYLDDVGAKGYLPLTYEVPTMDTDGWTEEVDDALVGLGYGFRTLQVYARPLGQPDQIIDRDRTGGAMNKGLAIPMQWAWDIIDPRVYVQDEQVYPLAGAGTFLNVPITNRGDYPTPVNILLIVAAAQPAGSVDFTIGSASFTITVPNSTEEQVIRYSARQKVLTIEEEGVETLRMDLLDLQGEDTHPQVLPGTGAFSMVRTAVQFATDSRLFFNEAYA